MYKIEFSSSFITTEDYVNKYLDIPTVTGYCQNCNNYNKSWACPPFDFDQKAYLLQRKYLNLLYKKIIFDEVSVSKTYSKEELDKIVDDVINAEKYSLAMKLFEYEDLYHDSISISAGSCNLCQDEACSKLEGNECRHSNKLRYSLEALGGIVGKTIQDLSGIELLWVEEGKLPSYFVLVSGLLSDEIINFGKL